MIVNYTMAHINRTYLKFPNILPLFLHQINVHNPSNLIDCFQIIILTIVAAVHAGLIPDDGRDRSHAVSSQSIVRNDQPIHQVTAHFTPVVQHPVVEHAPATLLHHTSYLEHSPVVHATPLVHHVSPLVHHLTPVHGPLVQHVAPAVHAPLVQHVTPALHGPLVQHVAPVTLSVGRAERVEEHVSFVSNII